MAEDTFKYEFRAADTSLVQLAARFGTDFTRIEWGNPSLGMATDPNTGEATTDVGASVVLPVPTDTSIPRGGAWIAVKEPDSLGGRALGEVLRMWEGGMPGGTLIGEDSSDLRWRVWLHWRNRDIRNRVLKAAGDPRCDVADPGEVSLASGDKLHLPVFSVMKTHVVPVLPLDIKADPSRISATHETALSPLGKVFDRFDTIETRLDLVAKARRDIQSVLAGYSKDMDALNKFAGLLNEERLSADRFTARLGERDNFGGAPDRYTTVARLADLIRVCNRELIGQNGAWLTDAKDAINAFEYHLGKLHDLLGQPDNAQMLHEVSPLLYWWPYPPRGTHSMGVGLVPDKVLSGRKAVDRLCEIAAASAFWIGESPKREHRDRIVGKSVEALSMPGTLPNENTDNFVTYACALMWDDRYLGHSRSLASLCSAVLSVHLAEGLQKSGVEIQKDLPKVNLASGSRFSPPADAFTDARATIMKATSSVEDVIVGIAKDAGAPHEESDTFSKAVEWITKAKENKEQVEKLTKAFEKGEKAHKGSTDLNQVKLPKVDKDAQVKRIIEALTSPEREKDEVVLGVELETQLLEEKLQGLKGFGAFRGAFEAVKTQIKPVADLLEFAFSVYSTIDTAGKAATEPKATAVAKALGSSLKTTKSGIELLVTLGQVTESLSAPLVAALGRASFVLGFPVGLIQAQDAMSKDDPLSAVGQVLSAEGSLLIALGPPTGGVTIVWGVAAMFAGNVLLGRDWIASMVLSEAANQYNAVIPAFREGYAAKSPAVARALDDLDRAFRDAVFSGAALAVRYGQ